MIIEIHKIRDWIKIIKLQIMIAGLD